MATSTPPVIRLGTRGSALALAQARLAAAAIRRIHPQAVITEHIIRTLGDHVTHRPLTELAGAGATGLFSSALEASLLAGDIDVAVHSAKDLTVDFPDTLAQAAFLPRGDVRDVLISRHGVGLADLPHGAVIGTGSPRRIAQLLLARPDITPRDFRGNIDSRIRAALAPDSPFDAIVLARAGLERLALEHVISETLSLDIMLPAPAQGAICLQTRSDAAWLALLAPADDPTTRAEVAAEQAFLRGLGGGCAVPVATWAHIADASLTLRARVLAADGSAVAEVSTGPVTLESNVVAQARAAGLALAGIALERGAAALMEVQR
jgi:hydroxymethylbilane synthase